MSDSVALIDDAYELYADAIFRHCYLRLSNREVAKDLMQETFIKAFKYAQKGDKIENVRALLYRIANNLVIDFVRKAKETSLDALQEAGFDPTGSDDTTLGRKLEEERVLRELRKLTRDDRQVITMRFVDELKPQEIAEVLGLSANVVSVRIHRALKELKLHLKP